MDIDKELRDKLFEFLRGGYITKAEMSRQIDIAPNTLTRVLDEDNERPWTIITRVRIRSFIQRYEREHNDK